MRLSGEQVNAIRAVVSSFDPAARVYLFGSRTDDRARGGDIDLLVLSDILAPGAAWDIEDRLMEMLGEQRIDVLLASEPASSFQRMAYKEAVKL